MSRTQKDPECQVSTVTKQGIIVVNCPNIPRTAKKFAAAKAVFYRSSGEWLLEDCDNDRDVIRELFGIAKDVVSAKVDMTQAEVMDNYLVIGGYVLCCRNFNDGPVWLGPGVSVSNPCFPKVGGAKHHPRVDAAPATTFIIRARRDFAEARGLQIIDTPDTEEQKQLRAQREQLLSELQVVNHKLGY